MRIYPRFGEIINRRPQGLCKICGQSKSDCVVTIQTDIFRGNDLCYKVHRTCIKGMKKADILVLLIKDN